jgi:hypothetical protein
MATLLQQRISTEPKKEEDKKKEAEKSKTLQEMPTSELLTNLILRVIEHNEIRIVSKLESGYETYAKQAETAKKKVEEISTEIDRRIAIK